MNTMEAYPASKTVYPINDIFHTIQGEGVHAGTPAIFIRMQGCPVACPFCDTKETWDIDTMNLRSHLQSVLGINAKYTYVDAAAIVDYLKTEYPQCHYIVLTGGEPALYDLQDFVQTVKAAGYTIALETSGTAAGHLGTGIDWVTVSPKIDMPGGKSILLDVLADADEIKQVVCTAKDINRLNALLSLFTLKPNAVVSLQPVSQQKAATALCIEAAKQYNWRLSIQVHKFVNIP